MTLQEKIATVPKLDRIDSSIESCIKILEQELIKREVESPNWDGYPGYTLNNIRIIKDYFSMMKSKK